MIKHYINEAGTDLVFDCGVNVGTVQDQYIKYLKPDGTTSGSFSASVYSSHSSIIGAIGTYFLKHTLITTDFNVAGEWKLQAYVAAIDGTWYGESVRVDILNPFE